MLLELCALAERARRLDHVVDPELLPRELRRVLLREDAERVAVDVHRVADELDAPRIAPVDAVESGRVAARFGRGDVVDRDEVEMSPELGDARDGPADATEAVARDAGNAHDGTSSPLFSVADAPRRLAETRRRPRHAARPARPALRALPHDPRPAGRDRPRPLLRPRRRRRPRRRDPGR